jgi:tRNA pseudouridine32 synthase/23S rRNA pseudouridine746 synthase
VRDGVSPSFVYIPPGKGENVLEFLDRRFPEVGRAIWISRMLRGEVRDVRNTVLLPDTCIRGGINVYYYRELDQEVHIPFEETILYQDEHLLIADKPHFLPVTPSGRFLHETLLVRLRKRTGLENLTPIHRLDRETAGVVIFSHDPKTRGIYQSLFQKRAITKVYEALAPRPNYLQFPLVHRSRMVDGKPFFRMQEEPGVPNSETIITLREERGELALYELRPITGRKHQLRLHMASLGIPILNDGFYPVALPCKADDVSAPLKLLARSLSFIDPLSGKYREFHSQRCL